MTFLNHLFSKKNLRILGLMSGTSFDGLDIALIETEADKPISQFRFVSGETRDYSPKQREMLLSMLQSDLVEIKSISQINFYLAQIWAKMIDAFLQHQNINRDQIDLIGSHGQTFWHQPDPEFLIDRNQTSTLQLGDPSVLAQLTGIPVIGDFRVADVALGGQGAPLIPYFDWIYFSQFQRNILAVNIGGISNFSFIPANGNLDELRAFDCGPGNMLIDQAMQILYDVQFDKDGKTASEGKFSKLLFEEIRQMDPFIGRTPPKSTGRELYNRDFISKVIQSRITQKLQPADIINTLTEYTAHSIHFNYTAFLEKKHPVDTVVLGGGGASNLYLVNRLQELFGHISVKMVREYGLNEEFKEAIGFAILAHESIYGRSTNVPQVTQASRPAILGKFCPA